MTFGFKHVAFLKYTQLAHHYDPDTLIAGTFYIHAPPDAGRIVFHDPRRAVFNTVGEELVEVSGRERGSEGGRGEGGGGRGATCTFEKERGRDLLAAFLSPRIEY